MDENVHASVDVLLVLKFNFKHLLKDRLGELLQAVHKQLELPEIRVLLALFVVVCLES